LLIREHQKHSVAKFVLPKHFVQLVFGFGNSFLIVAVDDENEALGILKVMPPKRTDLVLTADVPHGEGDVLIFYSFYVEADGGNGSDDFAEFQLVEDGRLSGGVEANHENPHLLLAEEASEEGGDGQTHDFSFDGIDRRRDPEEKRIYGIYLLFKRLLDEKVNDGYTNSIWFFVLFLCLVLGQLNLMR